VAEKRIGNEADVKGQHFAAWRRWQLVQNRLIPRPNTRALQKS